MKTLYLVRHAKPAPNAGKDADLKRTLSEIGQNEAQAMSKRCHKKGIAPELCVSSPAARALETAQIFATGLKYPAQQIQVWHELYEGNKKALKALIRGLEDQYATVMLFGHNPALSELASDFLRDFDAELRTSGVVGIAFEVATWQELSAKSAKLLFFDFPVRATPKVYKKAKKTLIAEMTTTMAAEIVENLDVKTSKQLSRIMQKTSKKLAKAVLKVIQAPKVEELARNQKLLRVDHLQEAKFLEAVFPAAKDQRRAS